MGCEVLIERDREGCSTKSPSPHSIPEEGIEIKPWGLLYLVGLHGEAWPLPSTILMPRNGEEGAVLDFQSGTGGLNQWLK